MAMAMLFMLMLSQLATLAAALRREGADAHENLRPEGLRLALAQKSGTVPLNVNKAIRRARGLVKDRLGELTAEVATKKADAEASATRREEMVEKVASHAKTLSDHEEQSRAALVALEQSSSAHDAKSQDFEAALAEWQNISGQVKDLTKTVDDTELDMLEKIQAMKLDLDAKKKQLGDEELVREEAEKVMMSKKADAEAAGSLKAEHEAEKEKAEANMRAARAALADQQAILDEAVAALELARAEASKATSQAEHLQLAHRKEQDGLALLLEVRKAIQDFYSHMDTLTQSMEKTTDRQPTVPAWQLLAQDSHLKPALESYNDVVKAFRSVHIFNESLYATIREAVAEIKQNSWSAILLQCDPGEKMEIEAEAKDDFADLQEKCGTGLWKAVGLAKLRFPAFQGAAEQLDEWWDEHAGEDDLPSPAESPAAAATEEANEGPFSTGAEEHAEDQDVAASPSHAEDEQSVSDSSSVHGVIPAATEEEMEETLHMMPAVPPVSPSVAPEHAALTPQETVLSAPASASVPDSTEELASLPAGSVPEEKIVEEAHVAHIPDSAEKLEEEEEAVPSAPASTSMSVEEKLASLPAASEEEKVGEAHVPDSAEKLEEEEAVPSAPASTSMSVEEKLASLPAASEEEKVGEAHVPDSAEKLEEEEAVPSAPASTSMSVEEKLASLPAASEEEKVGEAHVPDSAEKLEEVEEAVPSAPASTSMSVEEKLEEMPATSTAPLSEAQFEEMTDDASQDQESTPSPAFN